MGTHIDKRCLALVAVAGMLLSGVALAVPPTDTSTVMTGTTTTTTTATATADLARAFGGLIESYATIVGIWYAFRSVIIFTMVTSGRAQQGQSVGTMLSTFTAGVLAFNSREFFDLVNNTIPMIPDFGKLVYDAELMLSLM
ncbi:hypothetical protein [Geopseudomonas aromaticivorans]